MGGRRAVLVLWIVLCASARLCTTNADALDQPEDFYRARNVLRAVDASAADVPLLARLAEMEDVSGGRAVQAYVRLVEAMEKAFAPRDAYLHALERGLEVALRDNETEQARWFQIRLSVGTGEVVNIVTRKTEYGSTPGVWIPGGLNVLSFIARSNEKAPPERFFVHYARTVVEHTRGSPKNTALAYQSAIQDHFKRIAALETLGKRSGNRVIVTVSPSDRKLTDKVCNVLGLRMKFSKDGIVVEAAEKGARVAGQDTASALAVDTVAVQEALGAGKFFQFEIPYERAGILLGEEAWRTVFYPKQRPAGGFAEILATDPKLARVYVGLSSVNANTALALTRGIGLKSLAEKYSALVYHYASALAVENDRVTVPGGEKAELIWQSMAGVSPREPVRFLYALLTKDEAKLLAYFATLAQLDIQHQRFFTRNEARTQKFYELFREAAEMQRGVAKQMRQGSFLEFLREVPLDRDGNVDFPGSPEVWMVAKGQSSSTARTAKLIKKLSKVAAPEVEDEILLRLARTRYKNSLGRHSELDNFLAVVRLDAHRRQPLDEAAALTLAQHFAGHGAAYPYFAILTGLEQPQFEKFFALLEKLHQVPEIELNTQLGQLHALIELLCLAKESSHLSEAQSTELFNLICDRLARAATPSDWTRASLDIVRQLLKQASQDTSKADEAMRLLLLGSESPQARRSRYQRVLELQKVTSLDCLFGLYDAANSITAGRANTLQQVKILEDNLHKLQTIEIPKASRAKEKKIRLNLESYHARKAAGTVKRLRQKTAKRKVNPKDLEKLSGELLSELNPQVKLALTGIVYARFLSPDDLLISEDPLFLRKHEYFDLSGLGGRRHIIEHSELKVSSEKTGSRLMGGFADFATTAGKVAAAGNKLADENRAQFSFVQLGSLRATNWPLLRDEDLRLAALKCLVAREWIVRAATDREMFSAISEATWGLLSLARRADLLSSLAAKDWPNVWEPVTLSDLYFLGDRYLSRYQIDPWESPVTRALRREVSRNDGARLNALGSILPDLFGCSHPHLRSFAPYEEYERYMLPNRLAERSAEFKLHLVLQADRAGVPAAMLGEIAEPLAKEVLASAHPSDIWDWRTVLAAFRNIDEQLIRGALEK